MSLRDTATFLAVIALAVGRFVITANDGPIAMVSPAPVASEVVERAADARAALREPEHARSVEGACGEAPAADAESDETRPREPPEHPRACGEPTRPSESPR